jgi:hypothetical protein
MAGLDEAQRHVSTHAAQANHADLHRSSLFITGVVSAF